MKRLLAVLLFAAASAVAQPTITSVTPSEGPSGGGTAITIKGTGFETCPICSPPVPPQVRVGGIYSRNVVLVDRDTIRATTPAHLPKTVEVTVEQWNGSVTLQNAFIYTGTADEGFDRVLLPLFTGPVEGAFGSRFITVLRLANTSESETALVYGLVPLCVVSACVDPDPLESPIEIAPGDWTNDFTYSGRPGAFIYVPKDAPRIAANLRVYDETRDAFNFGTEMPVVHPADFTLDPIHLLGVPSDPRFRNTLRIYATAETSVIVGVNHVAHHVTLRPGVNELDPAYAQFSEFPLGIGQFDVTVAPTTAVPPMPGLTAPKVWAFISVTNNDTQLITTITPQ